MLSIPGNTNVVQKGTKVPSFHYVLNELEELSFYQNQYFYSTEKSQFERKCTKCGESHYYRYLRGKCIDCFKVPVVRGEGYNEPILNIQLVLEDIQTCRLHIF